MTRQINLSEETIRVVYDALQSRQAELFKYKPLIGQKDADIWRKVELSKVKDALATFGEVLSLEQRFGDAIPTFGKVWKLQDAIDEFESSVSKENFRLLTDHICNPGLAESIEYFVEQAGKLLVYVDGEFIEIKSYPVNIHKKKSSL